MSFLSQLFKPKAIARSIPTYQTRRYAGAGNQTAGLNGWQASQTSADSEIWGSLQTLINRSRSLYRDDSNVFTAIEELTSLVVDRGLTLQSKIKKNNGEYDARLNSLIEEKFDRWASNKSWASACGTMTFWEMQSIVFRSQLVDGGCLIRIIPQPFGGSPIPFALELIEVDQMDDRLTTAPNGNEIRLGVEVDAKWKTPVAYWILENHPGDLLAGRSRNGSRARRVPAEEILHVYLHQRPGQTRGVPAIAPGIIKSRSLLGLEEAEVTKARLQSCIGMVIQNESPDFEPERGEDGEAIVDLFPGSVQYLEPGQTMTAFDPSAPNPNIPSFVAHFQRSIAGIFGISAHLITKDLASANYSSLREGRLSEKRRVQLYRENLNRDLNGPIFRRWLDAANLSGFVPMPGDYELAKENKYYCFKFHGQPSGSIDATKDVTAIEKELALGLTTRTQILNERGADYEDLLAERAKEIALEKKYKVSFEDSPSRRNRAANDDITVNLSFDGQPLPPVHHRAK